MEELNAGPEPQRWTDETMYKPTSEAWEKMGLRRYTKKFIDACELETNWERIEDRPNLTWEDAKEVGAGEHECPICHNARTLELLHRGEITGIERVWPFSCHCRFTMAFWTRFRDVGELYYDACLDGLEPTSKVSTSLERQAEIIALMQEHPDKNFLLSGPPGSGKTHLMAALFEHAAMQATLVDRELRRGTQTVFWASTSTLMNEHVAKEMEKDGDNVPEPSVTIRKIQNAMKYGLQKPRLFLDDLDKSTGSPFKNRRLGELVNEVYKCKGQVCATLNSDAETLAVKWKDADEVNMILRRIGGDGGYSIDVR